MCGLVSLCLSVSVSVGIVPRVVCLFVKGSGQCCMHTNASGQPAQHVAAPCAEKDRDAAREKVSRFVSARAGSCCTRAKKLSCSSKSLPSCHSDWGPVSKTLSKSNLKLGRKWGERQVNPVQTGCTDRAAFVCVYV